MKEKETQIKAGLEKPDAMDVARIMASGLAHDLNNILTGLLGFNAMMLCELKEGDHFYTFCKEVEKNGNSVKVLSEKLIAVSRSEVPVKGPVDIKALISHVIGSSAGGTFDNVKITEELTTLPAVEADANKLSMAISLIFWWIGKHTKGEGSVKVTGALFQDKIRLSVSCSGIIVDKNILPYIFEPVYTTSIDRLLGFELAIARGIISEHGGRVEARFSGDNLVFDIDLSAKL